MGVLSEDEFKATAVPSQEMLRKLLTLALYGNDSFQSVFTAIADQAGMTARGREEREKRLEHYAMLRQMMMASQERIAEFQRRLDRLDHASYEALIENEENLRKAREELERVREHAYEITMPDGRVAKVYRDGDTVRTDDGRIVSPAVIRPEDIPPSLPDWAQRDAAGQRAEDLATEHESILAYRNRVGIAREASAEGGADKDALDDLEKQVGDIPASVQRHLGDAPETPGSEAGITRQPPAVSRHGPA